MSCAAAIAAAVREPAKVCALFLSSDIAFVVRSVRKLTPSIVHLGAAPGLVTPEHVLALKRAVPGIPVMRSVPVVGPESIEIRGATRASPTSCCSTAIARTTSRLGRSASHTTGVSAVGSYCPLACP